MKVRMKVDVSGSRDGQAWPPRGDVVDLPREEAVQLCSNGMAAPADARGDAVEAAVLPQADVEARETPLTTQSASAVTPGPSNEKTESPSEATPESKPAPRRPGRPKKAAAAAPGEKK